MDEDVLELGLRLVRLETQRCRVFDGRVVQGDEAVGCGFLSRNP